LDDAEQIKSNCSRVPISTLEVKAEISQTFRHGPAVRSKKNALVCWQRRRIFITESVRAQNYRFLIQAMGLDRLMRVAPASISGFATLLPFGTLLLTTLSRNPIFSSSE
jgi:hypothetical protein